MAIRKEKYVDIVSKNGGASVASRRSMTARVFTSSAALGFSRIVEFSSADEVMDFFGASSKEYQFAVRYFAHVSKSATRPPKISFAGWGRTNAKEVRRYHVSINSASMTDGGVVAVSEDGETTLFNTIHDCLERLGSGVEVDVTLNTDIVYISAMTARDDAHIASLQKATGLLSFTQIPLPTLQNGETVPEGFDEDSVQNLVPSKYIFAVHVRKGQTVRFDLNGHLFGGDTCCFLNFGTLTLSDSVGTGRAFTTNLNRYVYRMEDDGKLNEEAKKHYSADHDKWATCNVVQNHGRCEIVGGWYGTAKCDLTERLNETTWGSAVSCHANSVTTINGGYFTGVTFGQQAKKVAADTRDKTILWNHIYEPDYWPYSTVIKLYKNAQVLFNGGVVFGLYNAAVELQWHDCHGMTPDHPYMEVKGGAFYFGYPNSDTYYPVTVDTAQTGFEYSTFSRLFIFGYIYNYGYTCIPPGDDSNITDIGRGICVIDGAKVFNKVSRYTEDGEEGENIKYLKRVCDDYEWACARFSGDIFVKSAECNFVYASEFDSPIRSESEIEEYSRIARRIAEGETSDEKETPVVAMSRVDALNDDFGSFCFVEKLTPNEMREVALWNAAKNFKYLYSIPVTPEDCKKTLFTVRDLSGTVFTLDKFDALAEYMPMALFAATRYDRVNATKVFMYQQFDGETPSVVTSQDADLYDAFDIDGLGTCLPVNYLGAMQQAGALIPFYQDGYNADGLDTACYCNEVWLKDAISVELLNTFIAVEKMPANDVGEAMCRQAIATVVGEGILNGTVEPHKELDNVQMTYIDQTSGEAGAWQEVRDLGYWLKVTVKHRTLKGKRVQYYADYVLIYSKGDAIRKVEGSDILI